VALERGYGVVGVGEQPREPERAPPLPERPRGDLLEPRLRAGEAGLLLRVEVRAERARALLRLEEHGEVVAERRRLRCDERSPARIELAVVADAHPAPRLLVEHEVSRDGLEQRLADVDAPVDRGQREGPGVEAPLCHELRHLRAGEPPVRAREERAEALVPRGLEEVAVERSLHVEVCPTEEEVS
jgi:hypothetical protein